MAVAYLDMGVSQCPGRGRQDRAKQGVASIFLFMSGRASALWAVFGFLRIIPYG